MKATIFNLQKFSIHDGPGIRTVVFFKGCPLHCLWCSNPESQSLDTQIIWHSEKCLHCKLCEKSCPSNCIHFDNTDFQFKHENCTSCMTCVNLCPGKALEYTGKLYTLDQVIKEVMKDFDFYEESGGGVTLSGGEVLAQPEFAETLLYSLQNKGVHTAMETTGYASEEVFRRVASQVNLLLFDMKHYDNEKHIKYTGVSNDLIIQNMKWSVENDIPIIARIPVIPNINDTLEDADKFCDLLKNIGIKEVNLLPFHQFGMKKYENLHMEYKLKDTKALHPEDLKDYYDIFKKAGFDIKL